jgi:hypothetical protein
VWIQGDHKMTASNSAHEGLANTRESAILSGVVEALAWQHTLDTEEPRKGQRVVILPKEVTPFETVLTSSDPSLDSKDGHDGAYTNILQHCQTFENPPAFIREDRAQVCDDPIIAQNVSEWMAAAKQVETGSRKRVLENGSDKENSDDEEDPNMQPDVLTGMYTSDVDPLKGPIKLTQAQVAAQKAAAKVSKVPPRSQSPMQTGSSDDDDPDGSQYIWSQSKPVFRRNKRWVDPKAPKALPAPDPQKALPAPEPRLSLKHDGPLATNK